VRRPAQGYAREAAILKAALFTRVILVSRIYKLSILATLMAIAAGIGVLAIRPAMEVGSAAMMVRDAARKVEERKAEAAIAPAPRLIAGKEAYIFGPCQFSILSAKIVGAKLMIQVEYRVNSVEKKLDLLTPTYWNQGINISDEFKNSYDLERRDNYVQTVVSGKPFSEWWKIEAPIPAAKSLLLDFPSTIIDGSRDKIMRFELPISFISK
jgi:hypothetical protein